MNHLIILKHQKNIELLVYASYLVIVKFYFGIHFTHFSIIRRIEIGYLNSIQTEHFYFNTISHKGIT